MGYTAEAVDYVILDPGVYPAVFVGVTPSVEDGQFGPYLDWEFTVVNEMLKNVKVMGRSGATFTPTSKAREWAEGLLGRRLTKSERLDFGTLAQTPCQLVLDVTVKEKGTFNRITRILPAPKTPPAAHVVNEQPSRAAFEARFAAQAKAAWEAAHGDLTPDDLPPAPTSDLF